MESDCADFRNLDSGAAPEQLRASQERLYRRHGGYVLGVLRGRVHRLLQLAGMSPEDLLHETFFRAFDKSAAYRCGPGEGSAEEWQRTRAWLGRIAERLLSDRLRGQREIPATMDLEESAVQEDSPQESAPESTKVDLVREALMALTEREQDILRVTALYHRVGEAHQRLPNEVVAELSRAWGISAENIRAIRKRSLLKIKVAVEQALLAQGDSKGAA